MVKNGHVTLVIIVVGAALLFFMWRFTGAASDCSFMDALLGKCGVS